MSDHYKYILASFLLGVITNHIITTYCYSNLYEGIENDDGQFCTPKWFAVALLIMLILLALWSIHWRLRNILNTTTIPTAPANRGGTINTEPIQGYAVSEP